MIERSRIPANRLFKLSIGILRISIYAVLGLFFVLHGFDQFKPIWNYIIGALLVLYSVFRIYRFLKEDKEA